MSTIQMPSELFIEQLKQKTTPLKMSYLTSGEKLSDLPLSTVPEFALVGRSNVGKSSLLNFIAGQKNLARVSHTPGRTQLIHLFKVEKGEFIIADLPGYGYAEMPQHKKEHWEQDLKYYFQHRQGLCGILQLIDMRRDVTAEDQLLSRWFQYLGLDIIGVQTKCDKVNKSKWNEIRKEQGRGLALTPEKMVTTSVDKKIGLANLLQMIASLLDSFEK